jgi:hypothetical protein
MVQLPLPSAPPADDPINEPLINISIYESDSSEDTIVVDKEPIYKWCLIYAGIFFGGGVAICLMVYFFWH